ncbi:MAG TPA: hypothetical protein PKA64_26540, partial [Myxococcota bacterium]|nr:hypothetical protein [Myxococcota bacterium]
MLRTLHPVLRYAILATPVCVLAFLLMSSFFTGWDGRAVSRRPARSSDATVTAVLIVTDDGRATEVPWPRELAEGLGLPERAALVAPNEIPETAPHTTKLPFTLSFVVLPPGGVVMSRPTTTPSAVIVPFVLAGLGLLLFNVTQSGVPWSWRPEEA